jgi:Flp pilus assembly protein TadG
MKKITQVFTRFLKNDSGNIAISFGILFIPISMAFGAAVDLARQLDAKQSLTAAMDAAVLAGTQFLYENKGDLAGAQKVAADYFNTIIPAGKFETLDIKFKLNSRKNGIAAYGNAAIPTTMLKALGFERLDVLTDNVSEASSAEAEAPETELEVSVMLDVTSSMCDDGIGPCTSGSKLSALKESADTLVDTLIPDKKSDRNARVALIPFSTRVRVGPNGGGAAIMNDLTNLNDTWSGSYKACTSSSGSGGAETAGNWTCGNYETQVMNNWKIMPCVTDRYFNSTWNFETTDHAPGPGFWLNAHDGTRMILGPDSSTSIASTGTGSPSDPATHWNYNSEGGCSDVSEKNEIVPLTDDKDLLKARISTLDAYGATGGALGTAFSWYMISPEWASIWKGKSKPKDYDLITKAGKGGGKKLRKIAILMTDGSYNTMRGWKDSDIKPISDAALELCTNMKAKGIEVFTVGFELASLSASEQPIAEATLNGCASSAAHHFNSENPAALKLAFKTIGDQLAGVSTRLTK